MKKANKHRDKILRRNRERLRLHRKTKPIHDGHSGQQIETDRPGFNIFKWLSQALPRTRKDMDQRDRLRMAQRQGDR